METFLRLTLSKNPFIYFWPIYDLQNLKKTGYSGISFCGDMVELFPYMAILNIISTKCSIFNPAKIVENWHYVPTYT